MKYGIAWKDRNGEEHHRPAHGQFKSYAKAKATVKLLNDWVRVKGTGSYVVVEL